MGWGTPAGLNTVAPAEGSAGGTINVTLTAPTGLSDGDTLFAAFGDWQGSAATWTAPSGWTLVKAGNDGGSGNAGARVYGRYVAVASGEPGAYTWTYAPGSGNQALGVGAIWRVPGGATTLTADGTATSASDENSGSLASTAGPTTTTDGDLVLGVWVQGSGQIGGSPTWSTPSGWTAITSGVVGASGGSPSAPRVLLGVFYQAQATHGTVASATSTLSANPAQSWGNVAVVMALKPASGGSAVSGPDSATLADAGTVAAAIGASDAGAATDSSTLAAAIGASDSATLGEQAGIGLGAADSAALADAGTIQGSQAASDGATAGDTAGVQAAPRATDAATEADQATVAAGASAQDTATLGDQAATQATIGPSDAASLADAASPTTATAASDTASQAASGAVAATVGASDAATLAEGAGAAGSGNPSGGDSGGASDQASVAVAVASADGATLADAATLAATIAAQDAASLAERATIGLGASDAGGLSEQARVAASAAVADAAGPIEQASIGAQVGGSDAASGGESGAGQSGAKSDRDAATLGEATVVAVAIAATDRAGAVEVAIIGLRAASKAFIPGAGPSPFVPGSGVAPFIPAARPATFTPGAP